MHIIQSESLFCHILVSNKLLLFAIHAFTAAQDILSSFFFPCSWFSLIPVEHIFLPTAQFLWIFNLSLICIVITVKRFLLWSWTTDSSSECLAPAPDPYLTQIHILIHIQCSAFTANFYHFFSKIFSAPLILLFPLNYFKALLCLVVPDILLVHRCTFLLTFVVIMKLYLSFDYSLSSGKIVTLLLALFLH